VARSFRKACRAVWSRSSRKRGAALKWFCPWTEKRNYCEADQNAWTAAAPLCAWNDLETFSTPAC
jgi:hypothetical protein